MKELKIRLKHHLPKDVQESGKEFQDVFDALVLGKKISLGDYRFLTEALLDIHTEAVMIIEKYQTKIKEILGNIDFKSKNIKKDTDKVSEVRCNCDEIEPDINIDVSDIVEKHTLQLQEKFSKIGSHNLKAAQVVKPKTN
ncbi:uncharacterized protein [Mytilus edulis]